MNASFTILTGISHRADFVAAVCNGCNPFYIKCLFNIFCLCRIKMLSAVEYKVNTAIIFECFFLFREQS